MGRREVWLVSHHEFPPSRRRLGRHTLLATGGVGIAGAGALIYQSAPRFWRQYTNELKRPVAPARHIPDPAAWGDRGIYAAWLGHSTVLLKIDGFTMLTDPVFGVRAGIHFGPLTLGVKRLIAPALGFESLPHIDLVLLSHAHMDHFDIPTLRHLQDPRTSIVTARRTSDLLHVGQFRSVTEVGWDEEVRVGPAIVRGLEVNHWGARFRTDTYRGYNGYLVQVGPYRVLFGGDTAETDAFRRVGGRGVDLAIMPIGAYDPWTRFHCTPEQAWKMAGDARSELFLPVHHQTFLLSREPVLEPMERLEAAAGSGAGRIIMHEVGEEKKIS
jgi:L-ascorbate metabolism protein UlaG (beta-lactamase superfamily)